ncbi:MAG: sugar phosphate isomerase/epimerase family protein [Planctomycetota bacterium]
MSDLDRRALLLSAAAGATLAGAAVASPAAATASARPGRVEIKKALKYGMISDPAAKTVRERFQLARDCGFDGVELDSPSGLDEQEVLDAKAATGLEVPGLVDSVHWTKNLGGPDEAERAEGRAALEHALRQAKLFGASSVLLVPAVVKQGVSYGTAYRNSLAELRRVTPLAEELGVRIAIENVWNNFLLSPVEAKRYCEETGSPHVGWHLDVGNLLRYGWPEHWIEELGLERLFKLDIKEYSRKKMTEEGIWKGFDVKIGDGDCGWPRVMAALSAIGWSGWGAAEVSGGDRTRLTDIAARMDRAFSG